MSYFILFALLIFVLNVWATRVALRSDEYHLKKKMLIAIVWILPVWGALMVKLYIPARPQAASGEPGPSLTGDAAGSAPAEMEVPGMPPFPLQACMGTLNGIPFMDWAKLSEWAASAHDVALTRAAMMAGKRAWLLHLRDAFGPHFRLHETESAFVLSSLENRMVAAAADYIAKTRKRIERVLEGMAQFPPGEKSILLVVDDEDSYYHYISNYYSDGEFAFSSGIFIDSGCPHFVVKRADLTQIEPVIAHEMTHSAVSHLDLPKWLNEGIAVNTEHRITGVPRLIYTPQELRQKHLEFWGDAEIQEFWSGKSFHRADDGNLLSYELARIMVERMAANWAAFGNFVLHAQCDDAGAHAASEHMEIELGAYACALLEKERMEQWSPNPLAWAEAEAASSAASTKHCA